MTEKRLFLLDAYALIYRAYYALIRAPRVTSHGFNTSAIFGFVNTLDEVLKKENPGYIAVCFDPSGPTFRHEAYPEYKAGREKQPEDITLSVPFIKDIIKAWGISIIEVPGYEADDVIGTLSTRAEREGFTTYMMTPDKDYGQLVSDHVFMYKPGMRGADMEIRGPQQVCEKYGIKSPRQVIDLLALEGDAIDNIPGCPGVGEKTAVKLITEWGSVENLIDHAAEVKGAVGRKIADNIEQIKFSKYLATICTDVPVDIEIESLKRGEMDIPALTRLYAELEFRTLLKRIDASAPAIATAEQPQCAPALVEGGMGSLFDAVPEPEQSAPSTDTTNYRAISSVEEVKAVVKRALSLSHIGVACYAVGAEDMTSRWLGTAISFNDGDAVYMQMPSMPDERREMIDAIAPLFQSHDTTIVSHDVKREMLLLRREGVDFSAPYYDTSVAHYLLEPEMSHAIQRVAAAILQYQTIDYQTADKIAKKGEPIPPGDEMVRTCEIADITLRLYHKLSDMLSQADLNPLLEKVELPLVKVLADMEWNGVYIDVNVLAELSRKFSSRLHEMESQAFQLAGGQFNISSPTQVGEVLFERLKLDSNAKRTKRGAYSTTEEILEKYRDAHPIVGLILDIRGLRKLLTTYIDALPQMINPATGKIHTTFNQTVTATGRISSTNPNLQNIPIRTEEGREIRRAFVPSRGNILMSADYSQIELRVIADLSGDNDMIDAFLSGADIHQSTAAKIYHETLDQVTDEQRRRAKTANFGIIYGISIFGLSQRLSIPRGEAKELIDGYFRTYPQIREYIDKSIERARTDGYVTTVMGRKRMLPDINSRNATVRGYAERNAVNAPIQGTAADIIKLAMVKIATEFSGLHLKSKMTLQVHDELIFDIVPDELATVQEIVTRCMMSAYSGKVPLEVSSGIGANWLEAH